MVPDYRSERRRSRRWRENAILEFGGTYFMEDARQRVSEAQGQEAGQVGREKGAIRRTCRDNPRRTFRWHIRDGSQRLQWERRSTTP